MTLSLQYKFRGSKQHGSNTSTYSKKKHGQPDMAHFCLFLVNMDLFLIVDTEPEFLLLQNV